MNAVFISLIAGSIALLATAAAAADDRSDPQIRYQQDRAACFTGQYTVDRETCLREAGAALQEARRGGLDGGNEREFEQNRLARCNALPPADQEDCVRRMKEGRTSGSVEQGGILREYSRTLPPSP